MTAVLKITDGTTTVSLIKGRGRSGFHLTNWRPLTTQFKDEGVWQDPILADNRRLADYHWQNVIETFEVALDGHDQDALARELQTLQRLLVQAANYWKGIWQCAPVWIEARAKCETNTRYAMVHAGTIPEIDNPHAQPFFSAHTAMRDLTLIVERGHWLETAPGTGVAIERSNPGRSATDATAEVFVANKHNTAALTHVHYYDASIGSYSANIVAAVVDYKFLPDSPAAGDIVYFGIDTSGGRPFCSLVFDIRTAITGVTGITWEYSQGAAAWATLDVQDNTNHDGVGDQVAFDTTGVKSVHWEQPDDWDAETIDGTAAFWVRARVTAAAGATTPVQQNRNIYTVLWPYVEVAAAEVPGDIPALAQYAIQIQSYGSDMAEAGYQGNYAYVGLRSTSRGSNFTPFINLADEQNHAGITVTVTYGGGGTAASVQDFYNAASGRAAFLNEGGGGAPVTATIDINLDTTISQEYYGTFKALLRYYITGKLNDGETSMGLSGTFGAESIFNTGNIVAGSLTETDILLDMGKVTIPGGRLIASDVAYNVRLTIAASANDDTYLTELILLPVDEYALHIYPTSGDGTYMDRSDTGVSTHYLVDAIDNARARVGRAFCITESDEYIAPLLSITNGPAIWQANAAQRLWSVWGYRYVGQNSHCYQANTIDLERQARYLSLRGNR